MESLFEFLYTVCSGVYLHLFFLSLVLFSCEGRMIVSMYV